MVSVFPGRFVTEPQKAPALTWSQTVKAVTGESRGRTGEQARAEREEGVGGAARRGAGRRIKRRAEITMDNQHSVAIKPSLQTLTQEKQPRCVGSM